MQKPTEDPRIVYGGLLEHPHYRSATRPHMSLYARAAQFSSFDALPGFYDMIAEEERLTEQERLLDENEQERLNRELLWIAGEIEAGRRPRVLLTVFVPDARKAGGSYERFRAVVRNIDSVERCLILESRSTRSGEYKRIALARIHAIYAEPSLQ